MKIRIKKCLHATFSSSKAMQIIFVCLFSFFSTAMPLTLSLSPAAVCQCFTLVSLCTSIADPNWIQVQNRNDTSRLIYGVAFTLHASQNLSDTGTKHSSLHISVIFGTSLHNSLIPNIFPPHLVLLHFIVYRVLINNLIIWCEMRKGFNFESGFFFSSVGCLLGA